MKNKVVIPGVNTNDIKVLKKDEVDELFREYKKGNLLAKDKIVEGNLKLVLSIINKYNNGKNDMNDLFQIGCVGLIKAVDNFDPSYNCLFSTYAVPLIMGEVKRYIRDSTSVRVSRSIRDLSYKIMMFKDEFASTHGYEATSDDITSNLGITEYELSLAENSLKDVMSIYEPIYNDGGDTIYLMDQLASVNSSDINKDDLISLRRALTKLKEREREILINRYIIGKTQMELASEMGVSQAQVSRIEKSAVDNVKKMIR